jgi:Zn-dependent M28 family amino/carboxypeptidase
LFGSRHFVRRFHVQLDKDLLYVVNADCVGVGELLAVHSGQGTLSRRQTDPVTLERVERVAGQLGVKTIRTWESIISGGSSDHAEWVNRGYRQAISILRENYRPISLPARIFAALLRIPDANQLDIGHIHTPADTIEAIRPQILEETAALAEAYVRDIDQEWGEVASH